MKLGTRTRYSARAMLDLALNYENGSEVVPAKEISTRQQVSPKYLEHLLGSLRSAGLARSVRGARGGYTLTRPPDQISLREIYQVSIGIDSLDPNDKPFSGQPWKPKSRADSQTEDIVKQSGVLREYREDLLNGGLGIPDDAIRQREAKPNAYEERRSFGTAIQGAVAANEEEKWQTVVDLLEPYEAELSKEMMKWLHYGFILRFHNPLERGP